jgi:hypothetical protein
MYYRRAPVPYAVGHMVLEEFRIGDISGETELQVMRSQTTDLLM